ncbi:MAG TPA: 2-oxoacid:ferredoxin oxidoreductase subunit beta, partial [Anaerolineales bacterium]|nr:2-oxoacid:ferredoxin oxidoreductase subunit beta [Anaerolineales bacterium]
MAPSRNKTNAVGLEKHDYRGAESSLCAGCGHTSVGSQIITTAFELGLQPEQVVKFSGIGCSSKSPAYFMSRSFAFNAVHGRMPAVASGAMLA